ncbi:MAG: hypothetical protein QXS91_02705 [Candidatus Anstonellales archaeon]
MAVFKSAHKADEKNYESRFLIALRKFNVHVRNMHDRYKGNSQLWEKHKRMIIYLSSILAGAYEKVIKEKVKHMDDIEGINDVININSSFANIVLTLSSIDAISESLEKAREICRHLTATAIELKYH